MKNKWQYRKIGDVCVVERGSSPRPIDQFITEDGGGINWIKIGDTTESMYITETAQKIKPEGMKKSRYVEPGDFLLSNSMSFGRPYILKIDGCIHDGWLVLKDKDEIFDKRFLYYYLSSKATYQKFKHMAVGGVVNNLNSEMVRKIDVPVPSKDEQMDTADLLDKICNIISLRKRELNCLDDLIRARFVEMFGDIRYEEKYQGIPLRRLCTTISGGTPSTKCSEYYEGNIPWISTVSLGPNYIDGSTAKGYITQEAIDNSATKLIPAGNILFGTRVGVGKSSINDVALCINQDIVAIVGIDKNRFNVLFIKYVLDTYQSYYDSIKKGATILGITGDDLKNTLIPVPPLELQNQFADFVKVVDKSKAVVQKALDQTQQLFDSLMQEYFG